jgi:hypothetical protein
VPLATLGADGAVLPVKWLRKRLAGRPIGDFMTEISALLPEFIEHAAVDEIVTRNATVSARLDFSSAPATACIDSLGRALADPPERKEIPLVCRGCDQLEHDSTVQITSSPAYAWRRLGLVEPDGTPTRRGVVFSFFQAGEGLAIAAALEEEKYPIDDLVFDLANIRGGPALSPAKTRSWAAGSAFSASASTIARITPAIWRWARRRITVPAHRK